MTRHDIAPVECIYTGIQSDGMNFSRAISCGIWHRQTTCVFMSCCSALCPCEFFCRLARKPWNCSILILSSQFHVYAHLSTDFHTKLQHITPRINNQTPPIRPRHVYIPRCASIHPFKTKKGYSKVRTSEKKGRIKQKVKGLCNVKEVRKRGREKEREEEERGILKRAKEHYKA